MSHNVGDLNGVLARFSDSVFTAILTDLSSEQARTLAEKLCQITRDRLFDIPNGKTIQTSLSIGVAMIGETAPDAPELLSRAVNAAEKVKLSNKRLPA